MTNRQLEVRVKELESTLDIFIEDAVCGDCPMSMIDAFEEMDEWCDMAEDDQYYETCKRDRDSSVCTVRDCWMHYAKLRMAEEEQ